MKLLLLIVGSLVTTSLVSLPLSSKQLVYREKADAKQLECIATTIFHEARGESTLGQAAIARVVLNRVTHQFASTPCGVVHQSTIIKVAESGETLPGKMCQFTWACDNVPVNKKSVHYRQAEHIARAVLEKDAFNDVVPKSTLFFHNKIANPRWAYKQVGVIGNHVFYSTKKESVDIN